MPKELDMPTFEWQRKAADLLAAAKRGEQIIEAYNDLSRWPNIESAEIKMSVPANKAGPVIAQWIVDNWSRKLRPMVLADLADEAGVIAAMFGPEPEPAHD